MHMEFGPSWKQIEVNLVILSKMVKMTEFESLAEVCLWITLHSFIMHMEFASWKQIEVEISRFVCEQ